MNETLNTTNPIKECKHKWIPNGMISKTITSTSGSVDCYIIISSCVCENCGEIKTKIN